MNGLIHPLLSVHRLLQRKSFSLLFILVIKLALFCYFVYNFHHYRGSNWIRHFLFAESSDTSGYYEPAEDFATGKGYSSMCRMPGLVPIYSLFRSFLTAGPSEVMVILLQFLCGVLSVRALALIAGKVINSAVYTATLIVYTFSTFTSLWDNYGLSDSFSISFMIFSIYYLVKYPEGRRLKFILLSGLFFAWALFFRPITIVILPVHLLVLFSEAFSFKAVLNFITKAFVLCLPLILSLSLWIHHNYKLSGRLVVFQDTMDNCYPDTYPLHYQKLRDLSSSWGGDYQRTTPGGEMNWFLDEQIQYKKQNPFSDRIYTTAYNLDSLIKLREAYHISMSDTVSDTERAYYTGYVAEKSELYKKTYSKEHRFSYLVTNRIRCLLKFCFPFRLDDMPLPKLSEMNLFQKLFKGSYVILLHLINLLGLLAGILLLVKRDVRKLIFYCYPIAYLGVLSFYFGFIEMRYLAPVYPFFVIFSCYLIWYFASQLKLFRQ